MGRLSRLSQQPVIGPVARNVMGYMLNREAVKIAEHFSGYIHPQIAVTQEEKHEAFNIRHQVYCEELNFEAVRPNAMETDDFDAHSIHCLMRHKITGQSMGTVRVVTPHESDHLLPLEHYCGDFIEEGKLHPSNFLREEICEISRLAVPACFRRRRTDKFEGAATGAINVEAYSEIEMRCMPFIAIGLYLSAASVAIHRDIDHAFAMMEPRLARSMRFVGIDFEQLGPARDYHGLRAPYYISCDMLRKSLKPGLTMLYEKVSDLMHGQVMEFEF